MSEFTGASIASAMSSATSASAAETGADVSTPSSAAAGASPVEASSSTQTAATDGITAAPVAAPVDQPKTTTDVKPAGPIPFDAHKTALENARTKAAQEADAKYQWANVIAEQHRDTVGQFYRLLDAEPTQAVEVLISQIANDPQHAPKLRSLFGRLLGTRAQAAQADPAQAGALPEFDAEGVDEHGNRIPLYSGNAMQKFAAAIEARIDAKYSKKYGPLEQDFQTRQQTAADAKAKADIDAWAQKEFTRISQYPHFAEHKAAIAQAMNADQNLSVQDAYIQVVIPKLQMQERQSVVASLHDKSHAASIAPSNQATATSGRPKTFLEGFQQIGASALGGR